MKVKTEHKGGEDRGHTGHEVYLAHMDSKDREEDNRRSDIQYNAHL